MTRVAIQLPDKLNQFVNQSVQAGDFHNADEFFISVVSMYKDQVEEGLSEAEQKSSKVSAAIFKSESINSTVANEAK